MECVIEGDEQYYPCHDGKNSIISAQKEEIMMVIQYYEVYTCSDCRNCPHKAKCLYKYDDERNRDKNKIMKINETWEELQAQTHTNTMSEKGILNRQICSIQTEGHSGAIKENEHLRRINYR